MSDDNDDVTNMCVRGRQRGDNDAADKDGVDRRDGSEPGERREGRRWRGAEEPRSRGAEEPNRRNIRKE